MASVAAVSNWSLKSPGIVPALNAYGDANPAVAGRFGKGEPHFSGRPVADETDRVDGLMRAAGADDDFFTC